LYTKKTKPLFFFYIKANINNKIITVKFDRTLLDELNEVVKVGEIDEVDKLGEPPAKVIII
jgi:hypothetical protein